MRVEDIHALIEWHQKEANHCRVSHGKASTSRTRARWEQRRRNHARSITALRELLRYLENPRL